MAQRTRTADADDTPAGTPDERHWDYLADLGRYFQIDGMSSKGVAAIRAEWLRLDGTELPIPERVKLLSAFCVKQGKPEWSVRARVGVGHAAARTRPDDSPHTDRDRRLAADVRCGRLSINQSKGI